MDIEAEALKLHDDYFERGDIVFEELRGRDPELYLRVIVHIVSNMDFEQTDD